MCADRKAKLCALNLKLDWYRQGRRDPQVAMAYLVLTDYGSRKNSREKLRTMNGFCFELDNVVMAREFSASPTSHLSCELNSN